MKSIVAFALNQSFELSYLNSYNITANGLGWKIATQYDGGGVERGIKKTQCIVRGFPISQKAKKEACPCWLSIPIEARAEVKE